MNKKVVIIFFLTVVTIAGFITFDLPKKLTTGNELSLEEVKEKILLTKEIEVQKIPVTSDQAIPFSKIEDEKTIQEILAIVSSSYSPSKEFWCTLAKSDEYILKFLDEQSTVIGILTTRNSCSITIEGEEYRYILVSDQASLVEIVVSTMVH